jgi:hypothetical protein
MRGSSGLQQISIAMNIFSIISMILKWVYDSSHAINIIPSNHTSDKFHDFVVPIVFTKLIILFDCTIIQMASFSFLSILVYWLPDYFNTFSDLL